MDKHMELESVCIDALCTVADCSKTNPLFSLFDKVIHFAAPIIKLDDLIRLRLHDCYYKGVQEDYLVSWLRSWHDNWATLSTYFKYPEAVRRLIYTTNTIEGFNRQLRKVTKSKTVFPTDDSLLKCCIWR